MKDTTAQGAILLSERPSKSVRAVDQASTIKSMAGVGTGRDLAAPRRILEQSIGKEVWLSSRIFSPSTWFY